MRILEALFQAHLFQASIRSWEPRALLWAPLSAGPASPDRRWKMSSSQVEGLILQIRDLCETFLEKMLSDQWFCPSSL